MRARHARFALALAFSAISAGCVAPGARERLAEVTHSLSDARQDLNETLALNADLERRLQDARDTLEAANASLRLGRLVEGERDLMLLLNGRAGEGVNTLTWQLAFESSDGEERLVTSSVGHMTLLVVDVSTYNGTLDETTGVLTRVLADSSREGGVIVPPGAIVYMRAGTAPYPVREVVWSPGEGIFQVRGGTTEEWEEVPYEEGERFSVVFPGSRVLWVEEFTSSQEA